MGGQVMRRNLPVERVQRGRKPQLRVGSPRVDPRRDRRDAGIERARHDLGRGLQRVRPGDVVRVRGGDALDPGAGQHGCRQRTDGDLRGQHHAATPARSELLKSNALYSIFTPSSAVLRPLRAREIGFPH
jgi:hypothetical protein